MDDTENTENDDNTQMEGTQMDATNGTESPVLTQTQRTRKRESQRNKTRGQVKPRKRGIGNRGVPANTSTTRERNPSSSQQSTRSRSRSRSRSPGPPAEGFIRQQSARTSRSERDKALHDAASDLERARENRSRSRGSSVDTGRSPTRENRSPTPTNTPTTPRAPTPTTENPGPSSAPSTPIRRGPKKSSMIWNHCTEKIVDGIKYTFCKHCSSQWNLNGSTSTALQHIRLVHTDLI